MGLRAFVFVEMKDHTYYRGDLIMKYERYIDIDKIFKKKIDPFQLKLACVKRTQIFTNEGIVNFQIGDNFVSLRNELSYPSYEYNLGWSRLRFINRELTLNLFIII